MALLVAALGAALLLTTGVSGGYPRDVELIEPVTMNFVHNNVYDPPPPTPPAPKVANPRSRHHYPSYVKGQDPVEEYNRRRLHVDTSRYLSGHGEAPSRWDGHRQLEIEGRALRERYAERRRPEAEAKSNRLRQKKVQPRGEIVRRVTGAKGRQKVKDPIKRRVGRHVVPGMDAPRRYEESDPHVFPYERAEPVVEVEHDTRRQASLPDDVKFFHYLNFFGDGSFNAGSKRGNDQHYVEQHERGSHGAGIFQKRVKWADKKGGFGEHYWDLNHVTS